MTDDRWILRPSFGLRGFAFRFFSFSPKVRYYLCIHSIFATPYRKVERSFEKAMAFRQALQTAKRRLVTTAVGGAVVVGSFEYFTQLPSQGRAAPSYHYLANEVGTPLLRQVLGPEGKIVFLVFDWSLCVHVGTFAGA